MKSVAQTILALAAGTVLSVVISILATLTP